MAGFMRESRIKAQDRYSCANRSALPHVKAITLSQRPEVRNLIGLDEFTNQSIGLTLSSQRWIPGYNE